MRKKIKTAAIILTAGLLITGCSEIKADSPADGSYATQNRESAIEYGIYMNKQLTVFINEISTRMGIAKNITTGSSVDNEIQLTQTGIDRLQQTYDETATVYPSAGSDEDRDASLTAMQTALDHFKGYKSALETGESVEGYISDFQNDFNQLTGLANLYNQ